LDICEFVRVSFVKRFWRPTSGQPPSPGGWPAIRTDGTSLRLRRCPSRGCVLNARQGGRAAADGGRSARARRWRSATARSSRPPACQQGLSSARMEDARRQYHDAEGGGQCDVKTGRSRTFPSGRYTSPRSRWLAYVRHSSSAGRDCRPDLSRRLQGTSLTQPYGCHTMATVRLLCVGGCRGFS
jgi:hypothetical protein